MTPRPGWPYTWDENKREETLRNRETDFVLVEQIDWESATHYQQERDGGTRYSSYAMIGERLYNVVWTLRAPYTRIISLRKANAREIARYEQASD